MKTENTKLYLFTIHVMPSAGCQWNESERELKFSKRFNNYILLKFNFLDRSIVIVLIFKQINFEQNILHASNSLSETFLRSNEIIYQTYLNSISYKDKRI